VLIKKITLSQFRNYSFQSFDFSEKIVCICGPNGSGKTNLLDAIHFLCFTKSYFSKPENTNATIGLQGFRLDGVMENTHGLHNITCIYRENGRKEFLVNDEPCKKFSHHIGKFPAVFIAPDDAFILSGLPENRRALIDSIISQTDSVYLNKLIEYRKVLDQRNSFLKNAFINHYSDKDLLDSYDQQLCRLNNLIFEKRNLFLKNFLPMVIQEYRQIAGDSDKVTIAYLSQLQGKNIEELLRQNLDRDMYLQRTGMGIHKDDLEIKMNDMLFKNTASQGQRKSLLFALKLAAFEIIRAKKNFPPLLLLDDVFEKLDENRIQGLLKKVCLENDGQVFITDTHADRLQHACNALQVPFQLITL